MSATPGGDAAWAYDCATTPAGLVVSGTTSISVVCTKDVPTTYRLLCTAIDINAVGLFVKGVGPGVHAESHCSDTTGGVAADLDTATSLHTRVDHLQRNADELACRVSAIEAPVTPYTIRCTFSATSRQPIIGSIVMSQDVDGPVVVLPPGGVLATPSWFCTLSVANVPPTGPPTVTCETTPANTAQWFCHETFVQVIADPPIRPYRASGASCPATPRARRRSRTAPWSGRC